MAQRPWTRRSFLVSGLAAACGPSRCSSSEEGEMLTVDERRSYQVLEGWGTSLSGWKERFAELYPTERFAQHYLESLGASALRVDLRPDVVGPERRLEEIRADDYQVEGTRGGNDLRAAAFLCERAPLRVIATVWTPPSWMKHNGDQNPDDFGNGHPERENFALTLEELAREELDPNAPGKRARYLYANRLRSERRVHFAKTLVEWVRLYARRGAPLHGLSIQNEPRFSHWFGSCVYTAPGYAATLAIVERVFSEERVELPRLFGPETMTHDVEGNRLYLDALFRGSAPGRALHALACHGYVDGYRQDEDPASPSRFRSLAEARKKVVWMTEGGSGGHDWPAPLHELAASLLNALVHGGAALITPWQALSEEADEHALSPLGRQGKKWSIASHFFRPLQPGSVRIFADCARGDVAAFRTPKELVLQLLNRRTAPRALTLRLPERASSEAGLLVTSEQQDLHASRRSTRGTWLLPAESLTTARIPWRAPRSTQRDEMTDHDRRAGLVAPHLGEGPQGLSKA